MSNIIAGLLLMLASAFLLLAGIAIVRLPDLYSRLSAASKAISLGAAVAFLAAGIYFQETGVAARAVAGIAFFLLTSPVAAHVIGRAGWHVETPFWKNTINVPTAAEHEEIHNGE